VIKRNVLKMRLIHCNFKNFCDKKNKSISK